MNNSKPVIENIEHFYARHRGFMADADYVPPVPIRRVGADDFRSIPSHVWRNSDESKPVRAS